MAPQSNNAAAVVVSAGKMMKTVKVRILRQEWNKKLRKFYTKPHHLLVNDPTSALREGDVVSLQPWRTSKHVQHTVDKILAPFGESVDERPALMTEDERLSTWDDKRQAKVTRRASRGILSAINEARLRGWPIAEVQAEATGAEVKGVAGTGLEHGRKVRSDGGHEFGKINDEAWRGKQRAQSRRQKGLQNEQKAEKIQQTPTEEVAREKLQETASA